jgi:hypothetical protein
VVSAAGGRGVNPPRSEVQPYFDALVDAYRLYCGKVSPRSMAIAIETAAYAWWLCEDRKAVAVCDLGSGFTSYMLRCYADHAKVVVHSVDDSSYWLNRTVGFCQAADFDTDGFLLTADWLAGDQMYDVIVHDYASGETRNKFAAHAATRLKHGGCVVFDDVQNYDHHHAFADVCRQHGLTFVDVFDQTVDEIGRYAGVGWRP